MIRYHYSMLSLAPEGDKRLLLAFTSSHRFAGRFSFDRQRLRISQDLENIELSPGKSITLESMSVESGADREELLGELARRLNHNHPPLKHSPIPCGWLSWICFGPGVTSQDVASNSAWIKQNLPSLKYVQIDDGYPPWMGDWLDTGTAFGGGVENVLKQIRADGLEPALWTAPFVASPESELFKKHPDWFMKDAAIIRSGPRSAWCMDPAAAWILPAIGTPSRDKSKSLPCHRAPACCSS